MIRKLIGIALVMFILFGLLGTCAAMFVGRVGDHRQPSDDWWQGYMMGRLDEGEGGQVLPYNYPPGYGRQTGPPPLMVGMGLLCLLGLPLLLLLAVGCMVFRHHSGWRTKFKGAPPFKGWRRPHGPMPPWWRGWCEEAEEPSEEAPAEEMPR